MNRQLIRRFWNCGNNSTIQFALESAHLNRNEREAVRLMLDECMTQEEGAEQMNITPRRFQDYWYSATDKLLALPWLTAYAKELRD